MGRSVIVTGAFSRIGPATAEQLGRDGQRVILAARDLEQCEEAAPHTSAVVEASRQASRRRA